MSNNILSQFPEENNDYRRGAGYYVPITIIAILLLAGFVFLGYFTMNLIDMAFEKEESIAEPLKIIEESIVEEEITQEVIEEPVEEVIEEVIEEKPEPVVHLTDDDIMASVVMAEAGDQVMIGKVAVAITILNRCDFFDASVESIVTAPNQYSYPCTGVITEDCYEAVRIARENRNLFPKGMMWFLPSGYPRYGHPYLQIQGHYFSYLTDEEMEEG